MKIYPFEYNSIYAQTEKSLGFTEKARVTAIFKEYNWFTDDIDHDKRKKAAISNNNLISEKLRFFNITVIANGKNEIDISSFKAIDVDKIDKEEREAKLKAEGAGEFDYRDQFNFK